MGEIRAPTQAIVRKSSDIDHGQESLLRLGPLSYYDQPRLRKWERINCPRAISSWARLGMSKSNGSIESLPLPYSNTRPTPHSLSTKRKPLTTLDPTCFNAGLFDDSKPVGRKSGIADQEQGHIVVDARTGNHERRKKELLEALEPALPLDDSDAFTIFICWGKENCCHIVPVQIPNFANDVAIWQEIRRVWHKHRLDWRKRLKLFCVKEVRIVEVGRS
jgi:hypothetical protein